MKPIKKQRILKRDILIFKEYIYIDKSNSNLYHLFNPTECYILRYCKNRMQFTYTPLENIPKKARYSPSGKVMQYLKEFTTFKYEYKERKDTLNPRYDESLRVQVHTEYINRKRFKELERYFNSNK